MRSILIALLLASTAGPAFAEYLPQASQLDQRVRVATYVDGQVFKVNVSLLKVTSIELGRDEEIRSIVAGDTEGFDFDAVPGGRVVVVKPKLNAISTNITVYTTKRSYYFFVQEVGKAATHFVVRFNHPNIEKEVPANKTVLRTAPNYKYGADRLTQITPIQVWDDGSFTYFQFPRTGDVPAIFKTSSGREMTTNSNVIADGTVRVSGIANYWVLRAGDVENTIARGSVR